MFSLIALASTAQSDSVSSKNKKWQLEIYENLGVIDASYWGPRPDYNLALSGGMKMEYIINNSVSIRTGLEYLWSKSETSGKPFCGCFAPCYQYFQQTATYHFLEIPIDIKLAFLKSKKISLFFSGGASVQFGAQRVNGINFDYDGKESQYKYSSTFEFFSVLPQFSVGSSISTNDKLSFFVEPRVQFKRYFPDYQPSSFGCKAGLVHKL